MVGSMNKEKQQQVGMVPVAEIIKNLLQLCIEGRTGSLYLMTSTNEGAVFVLNSGDVVDVAFKDIRGTSALPLIRKIDAAKFFFKSGQTAEVEKALHGGLTLSFAHTLFRMFSLEDEWNAIEKLPAKKTAKKVLVVEDSRLSRRILVKTLKAQGYLVVEAHNGQSALEQLEKEAPDLVLLDLILPDIDGYEVFDRMKENRNTADIPVIILTSRASLMDKLKGKMSGSDEYLTKPIDEVLLLQKLEKYLH